MERGDGSSFWFAVSLVGFLVGVLGKTSPDYQWILDGIACASGVALIYACRSWKRAYLTPPNG